MHAVLVGEFNAAIPLIQELMRRHPDQPLVVTTITPTGSYWVIKQFGDRVFHVYLPYDLPAAIERFFARVKPRIAVVMETEIWPNLYFACQAQDSHLHRQRTPVRAQPQGLWAGQRIDRRRRALCDPGGGAIAGRRRAFPARASARCPNACAWSATSSSTWRCPAGSTRWRASGAKTGVRAAVPVWIAASTHEGEEAAVLQAHARILGRFPDALLILVPRHPERFRAAISLCRSYGFRTSCRSEDHIASLDSQCFVVDTMGELLKFYACSDACFVGGSLDRIGGHNAWNWPRCASRS